MISEITTDHDLSSNPKRRHLIVVTERIRTQWSGRGEVLLRSKDVVENSNVRVSPVPLSCVNVSKPVGKIMNL